ncbi:hypothetical protein EYR36_010392 [Pleurotus pulmonarius]|nr:hypothetical protein EYR36_010392 [Pleurotus pulmonarius]
MPKFSTHFPFIKSSRPGTPVPTQASTPEPDNPAAGNTTLGGAAMRAIIAPQPSTLPAVNVAPPTSAGPEANVAALGNIAEGQSVPRLIATDDPPKSWLRKLRTPGAMRASTPEGVSPAAGNVAAGNVATQGAIVPQVSASLPDNVAPSVGTELQANTSAPSNVAQLTGDYHVNTTDLTREAAQEGDVRPVTAAQAEPTPEIDVETTEIVEEEHKPLDTVLTSTGATTSVDNSHKGSPKTKFTKSTGWALLKGSLKVVNELSDAFTPLKVTVSAILVIMDYTEMVQGNEDKLNTLASEVKELVNTFSEYSSENIPRLLYDRLDLIIEKLVTIRNTVEQKMKRGILKRAIAAYKDVEDVVDMCEEVTKLLHSLSLQASVRAYINTEYLCCKDQLKNLGHVPSASINAISEDGCLEGTRKDILDGLQKWCQDSSTPPVYWLVGPAGAGKSTIAHTFCRSLRTQSLLGGSFFCHHPAAERANAKHITPTLAWGLAHRNSGYCSALAEMADITTAATSVIEDQIDILLKQPLMRCNHPGEKQLVLVIDALDECHSAEEVTNFLSHLLAAVSTLGVKVFITSRPEIHIKAQLQWHHTDAHKIFQLQDVKESVVADDISLFIQHEMEKIRGKHSLYDSLPADWPSYDDVKMLTHQAAGLFIYASTALKFLGENGEDPVNRLQTLLHSPTDAGEAFSGSLQKMYSFILSKPMGATRTAKEKSETKKVLEVILAASVPLTISMIAKLLKFETRTVRISLNHLHAVIHVPPSGHDGVVSTFHASFMDFLTQQNTNKELSEHLPMKISQGHELLANGTNQAGINYLDEVLQLPYQNVTNADNHDK